MKARKWLAGLLSVVMLITTVAPAAAAGGGTDTVPAEPSDVPSLPALEEVAELFNASPVPTGRQIWVSCIESGSDHPDFVKYDVEPSDITLGEIQGDAESGYTVEATIDYSRAIGLYCEANGPHEPDSVSSESTTRVLEHNGEAWVRENNNSLAVQLVHVSEEPAPEAGSVWGPGGENWKIQLTLVCENPEAVHEGGNSTKPSKKNFLSESDWDWENAELYQTDGVWYAACTLKGAELLDEAFGGTHTATGDVDYVLVYENEKWCIDTEAEIADVVVTGTCTESGPAAPALGENLDVWVQLYADDGTRKGSQIDRRPTQYGPSVSFGEPYAEEGVWKCEMTVIGHSDDPEMAEHCYVDQDMPEGYELADEAVKTVTITYDQSKGEWVCPEIPKEHLTSASTTKYGVSFKIREVSEETVPAAPSKEEVAELLNTTGIATGKEITISCTDGHASEKYPVQPEDVTVGEVEKDETYGYIVEVTVDMSRAVELFCQANGPHEVHTGYEMQSGCTLQYNSDKAAWVRNAKLGFGFFQVQLDDSEPEEPAPAAGNVYGPGGENWKIQLTLVCENPEAVHKGGNSTKAKKRNYIAEDQWDWAGAEFHKEGDVWYAECALDGSELLEEQFGAGHTAEKQTYTLVHENGKWCIDTEAELADVVITGVCEEKGPAAPVLGENLDVWIQVYGDGETPKSGMQLGSYPQYAGSVTCGAPYEEEGAWKSDVTVVGYTEEPEEGVRYYLNERMPEGYELAEAGTKTVTAIFDQATGEWMCPEIPKEQMQANAKTQYGVSFKIREISEETAPEAPNKDNCTDLSVTVYGASPRADGSTWNAMIVSGRWDMYPDTAKVSFGEPVQGADGVWTCEATVDAEARIAEAIESMSNSHYRDDETDPNTKTIVLTYDESNGKWRAPSDGVAYSTGTAARNGVAFRLIEQYVITYAPGRDTSLGIPEGETYESEPHDAGELVTLPTEPGFTTENGYFAGWKHSEDGVTEFYAPGAEIPMFAGDTELEAYWMDVTVQVATEPYDADKAAEDYTFTDEGNAITVEGEDVTLLYKATIKGNNKYPYELVCQDAQAAYGTELSGVFGFGTTSVTVYFTKNYVLPGSTTIQETVGLSGCAAADTVSTAVTVTSEEPGPSTDLTEEDIRALLENVELVTLRCTNSDYDHESVTYTLRDGFSFQKDSETVYTVTIHLDEDGYLDAYDSAEGRTHDTVGDADYSFQITWVDGAWTVPDAPAVIQVRCTSPSGGGSDSDDREQEHSSTVITGGSDEDRDDSGESNGGTVIDDNETPLAPGVFTDVPAGHWASEAVTFVTGRGIFTGTSATTFSPDMVMSRAMLATVLWRMEGQPAPGSASPFTDVPAGQWYTDAVVWAAGEGVVKGIGNDLFDPDGLVTREQMATMLYRYAGSPAVTGGALTGYGDQAQVSDFALQAMEWAVSQGILTGKPGSLLDPQGGVTRAEVAVILMRYIQGQEG
mgnify:CR=1 FL=1